MTSRENVGAVVFVVFSFIALLVGGPLYLWWSMYHRYEYLNERVAVCTITEKVGSDEEWDGYVETAQCGRLLFKPLRFGVEGALESGHTYRLRIAELEPQHGSGITGILGVEGEAGAP